MALFNFGSTNKAPLEVKNEVGNFSAPPQNFRNPLSMTINENKGEGIYNFGRMNNFPSELVELYDTSPTHQAVINRTSLMIAGDGIEIEENSGELLDNVHAHMLVHFPNEKEDLLQILTKVSRDLKLHGRYAIECTWNEDHDRVVELKHVDAGGVRVGILKNNEVPFYKFSNDWTTRNSDVITYPPFGRNNEGQKQLLYVQFMRSGHLYYGLPDYYASIDSIELESIIGISQSQSAKDGFSPKVAVVFPAKPESTDLEDKMMDNLNKTYSGALGKKIMGIFSPRPELKPEIIPLNVENLHNQYIVVDEQTQNKILTGHGVVSPILFGIRTSTGFSSNADELLLSLAIYQKTVVGPYQTNIERSLNQIMRESDNRNKLLITPFSLGIQLPNQTPTQV